ncbi:guanylate kinase [Sulfuriferula nivalis]|uniref:Guanylate kinase n=1 Tax=Sulfuriferula nivalis TaxID=2675298 RepID=A0A809RN32_9PROT|nr:guanylate kinase [Sulfuriferula nivalis]BBP02184.1 guanylate kinase [Sulfuriferula nivalis]
MTGNLLILTAPSGAGKTSLVHALLERDAHVRLSISYTTRAPRPGEVHGQDYHFVSVGEFMAMHADGAFLESAEVYGNHYGTSEQWIREALTTGQDVLLEIDWQGAEQVRRLFADAVGIFIVPPSLVVLQQRLQGRGQDSAEVVERRLAAAREDISHMGEFDYVIINDDFDTALADLQAVLRACRLRVNDQRARHAELFTSLS